MTWQYLSIILSMKRLKNSMGSWPGVNFINCIHPAPSYLRSTPNFWEAFYLCKSSAQGAKDRLRAKNSLWNRPLVLVVWRSFLSSCNHCHEEEGIGKILGKLPTKSKIPLQGNGMAAILKMCMTTFNMKTLGLTRSRFCLHFKSCPRPSAPPNPRSSTSIRKNNLHTTNVNSQLLVKKFGVKNDLV